MKKYFVLAAFLLITAGAAAQSYTREGNTFRTAKKAVVRDTLVTSYNYEDKNGNKYPIIVNRKSGACYIWRTSRNGKQYKQCMQKDIKETICKELGIKTTTTKSQPGKKNFGIRNINIQ